MEMDLPGTGTVVGSDRRAPVFDEIHRDYLERIATLDPARIGPLLGIGVEGEEMVVPFFGRRFRVSGRGVADRFGKKPDHLVNVILFQYLLRCPVAVSGRAEWVTYRDFKDSGPFAAPFSARAEAPLGPHFAGRPDALVEAAADLGGRPVDNDAGYDRVLQFDVLPKVPVFLLFNDADEDFGAACKLCFERRAEDYLDMESLAMIGMLLSARLRGEAKRLLD